MRNYRNWLMARMSRHKSPLLALFRTCVDGRVPHAHLPHPTDLAFHNAPSCYCICNPSHHQKSQDDLFLLRTRLRIRERPLNCALAGRPGQDPQPTTHQNRPPEIIGISIRMAHSHDSSSAATSDHLYTVISDSSRDGFLVLHFLESFLLHGSSSAPQSEI